jgi:hypothetical protein
MNKKSTFAIGFIAGVISGVMISGVMGFSMNVFL